MKVQTKSKVFLYFFFLFTLLIIYCSYIPRLLDYYIVRPDYSFFTFYNEYILDEIYTFEDILVGAIIVAIFFATMREGLSMAIISILLFILTHASYIKYSNRRELFHLDDLKLTEAAGMATKYISFSFDHYLLILLGTLLMFITLFHILSLIRKNLFSRLNNRTFIFVRIACLLATCLGILIYANYFFTSMLSIGNVGANNISLFYADKYVIYQFLENDNLASINIENINESYDFVLSQEEPVMTNTPSSYPNIIVVMNESWWNTDNIGSSKVTFSSDPMQPFKDLSSMCTTGYLTSNVYGGGTVSSEAEFLTGLDTKYYVSDAGIYSTTLNRKLPSIVDYFNSLDYNTIAIHPYYGSFYDRETIYKTMGFDKTVFDEDMLYRDIYTQYISDESLTKQIIHEYETAPNGNKFIWSVSIGNHIRVLDYDIEPITDYDYPISIELKDENLSEYDYNTLLNYVNGFYYANLAYKELVEYFENVDEPTIVLMYGDHIPNFSEEVRIALGIEGDEKCYNVPVILWSNIQGDMPEFTGEGIYYLPQMLLEYAQMPDSDMQRILRYERNYFKADSRQYILDAFGLQLTQFTKEQVQALKHYKTIEYDLILGDSIGSDVWNPIQ